jgi:hypothetical protein
MTIPLISPFYRVIVRNSARTRVGEIQAFTKISFSLKYNDVGTWSLDISNDHPHVRLLTKGAWLTFMSGDFEMCSGTLRGFKQTWGSSDLGTGTLTVYGPTAEVVISDRLAYPVPGSVATSQAGSAYDARSGPGETIIKAWVDANAGPSAIAARQTKGLTIETDAGRGNTIKGSARMDNLLTFIQPLAESADLGFNVQFGSDDTMTFQMFENADRSQTAKFGRELGNLSSFEYVREAPKSSDVVVGGSGDLTARVFREIVDTTSIADWGNRSETFVDRRDTADATELDQAATEESVNNGPVAGLTIKTIDTPNLVFGVNYFLGDTVSIPEFGISDVLRGVDIEWSASGPPETTSDVGTWSKTGSSALIKKLADLTKKLAALQTKK